MKFRITFWNILSYSYKESLYLCNQNKVWGEPDISL